MSQMLQGRPISATVVRKEIHSSDDEGSFRSKVMRIMDELAMQVAFEHAQSQCITKGIDSIQFHDPVSCGDLIICQAAINRVWKSSLEVGVKIRAEGFRDLKEKDVISAYFIFIALDSNKFPLEIAPVIPESEEEKRRFRDAEIRRLQRSIRRRSSRICLLNK